MQTSKIISVLVSLFFTTAVLAQKPVYSATINNSKLPEEENNFHVNLSPNKTGATFDLKIENPDKEKLQVQIRHNVLGTVLDTLVSDVQYNRRYNMENADEGRYTIIVKCGKKKVKKELELNSVTTRNVVVY